MRVRLVSSVPKGDAGAERYDQAGQEHQAQGARWLRKLQECCEEVADVCFQFFAGVFCHLSMQSKRQVDWKRVRGLVWWERQNGYVPSGPTGGLAGAFGHRDGIVLSKIQGSPRYLILLGRNLPSKLLGKHPVLQKERAGRTHQQPL